MRWVVLRACGVCGRILKSMPHPPAHRFALPVFREGRRPTFSSRKEFTAASRAPPPGAQRGRGQGRADARDPPLEAGAADGRCVRASWSTPSIPTPHHQRQAATDGKDVLPQGRRRPACLPLVVLPSMLTPLSCFLSAQNHHHNPLPPPPPNDDALRGFPVRACGHAGRRRPSPRRGPVPPHAANHPVLHAHDREGGGWRKDQGGQPGGGPGRRRNDACDLEGHQGQADFALPGLED